VKEGWGKIVMQGFMIDFLQRILIMPFNDEGRDDQIILQE
jgi:hypothetical protein